LLERDPAAIYLTHYGPVTDVARLGAQLLAGIDQFVEIGQRLRLSLHDRPQRHAALCAALADLYLAGLTRHGVADPAAALKLLALDVELNAQGIAIWLDREAHDATVTT
jgi:hypothetical protein